MLFSLGNIISDQVSLHSKLTSFMLQVHIDIDQSRVYLSLEASYSIRSVAPLTFNVSNVEQ